MCLIFFFFVFQAEDGIRDWSVTAVQTCALPISLVAPTRPANQRASALSGWQRSQSQASSIMLLHHAPAQQRVAGLRLLRSSGLPAFEVPCSRCRSPLAKGLGVSPA